LQDLPDLIEREPERGRRQVLEFYGRFVRRVLHYYGDDNSHPQDWPKPKYSFLATPIDEDPGEVQTDKEIQVAREYLERTALALDVGAYQTAQNWLKRAVLASHKIAWADEEVPLDLQALQDRYRLYLMSSTANGYIYPRSADKVVADEVARGNKDGETIGVMAFVQSARLSFDFQLLDRYLSRLDALAQDELQFVATSFRFERDAFQRECAWEEYKKRFRQAWDTFPQSVGATDDPVLSALKRRWIADAGQVWLEQLFSYEGKEPNSEVEKVASSIFQRLEKLDFYQPRIYWHLKRADLARFAGDLKQAQIEIAVAESLFEKAFAHHFLQDEEFWSLAREEKMVPVPSVTHLGILRAMLVRAKAHQLLARGGGLSDSEFERLGRLTKELEGLTDRAQVSGGRHAVSAAYNALLAVRQGPDSIDQSVELDTWIGSLLSEDPVFLAELLLARGELLDALSRPEEARAQYARAVEEIENYLLQGGASPAQAERLRALARPVYEKLAERLLQDGQREEALDILGRLAQIRTRQVMEDAVTEGSSEAVAQLAGKARTLRRTTAVLTEIKQETGRSDAITRTEDEKVVSRLLADTRKEFYSTVKELQRSEPDFSRLAVRPLNFARIQQAIPENTNVVQYFPAAETLYIFVASRERLVVRSVPLSREALDNQILSAISELSNYGGQFVAQGDWNHASVRKLRVSLSSLYDFLIEPILPDLQGRPVMAVIPSGRLSYLPFSTLMSAGEGGDARFLVQDFELVSVLKAVDLDSLLTQPASREGLLVGVGNPDSTLRSSENEMAVVAKLFPENQVLMRNDATVENVKKLLVKKPGFVHLATHGRVDSEQPLESYLVMADGRLNLSDITSLELGAPSLVTLSACKTALGQASADPGQDLTTLAEAFWFAGGRSLVASLWSVDDASTASLMVAFYGGLTQGQRKSEALRQAQLELLGNPSTSAPYQWAPFILIGDWR
jgi:CHAT domain-containing protein